MIRSQPGIESKAVEIHSEEAIVLRSVRFSIAGLMAAVAVAALIVAALRSSTAAWAGAVLMLVCSVLGLSIAGALFQTGSKRAWWLGFALFGCGYLVLAFWSEHNFDSLPTTALVVFLGSKFDPTIQQSVWSRNGTAQWMFLEIAHCLWALVAAILGGALTFLVFAAPQRDREQPVADSYPSARLPANWWRRPAFIWLAGLVVVGTAAVAGSRSAPGLWAGMVFLLTCGMLGLASLGAIAGRAGRRTMWLGAALFGSGDMYFTFGRSADAGWPSTPTTHLLNALRPGSPPNASAFPDASDRNNSLNASLLKALEQPIPMHFPDGAPLEDVLKYIRAQTEARTGKPIPIYVDPIGLQRARQTLASPVRIDVEGAAVKNSLARCLKQLDLSYGVRDGFLMITEAGGALPVYEDPFLIVGHCLLALIAAGIGGALAPLVADRTTR
jgi:hypothetical protein